MTRADELREAVGRALLGDWDHEVVPRHGQAALRAIVTHLGLLALGWAMRLTGWAMLRVAYFRDPEGYKRHKLASDIRAYGDVLRKP